MPKKILIPLGVLLLLAAAVFGFMKFKDVFNETTDNAQVQEANKVNEQPPQDASPIEQTEPEPAFDTSRYSLDDPASYWVIVNKKRPLNPKNYAPSSLVFPAVSLRVPGNESMKIRTDVAANVESLFQAAKGAGFNLMFSSGYRSYGYQVNLYGSYVRSLGQAEADTQSARPGHSEHQTGLALDVCDAADCDLVQSFGSSAMGKWVAENAHTYGFIIRYPEGKTDVTGYTYEPWHLRFVGKELAAEMHRTGTQTLEEFFGLPAAPDYL